VQILASALSFLGRDSEAAALSQAAMDRCLADQRLQALAFFVFIFAGSRLRQSRWDEAAAAFDEAVYLGELTGLAVSEAVVRGVRAELRAGRGDMDGCVDDCETAIRLTADFESPPDELFALNSTAVAGLSSGRPKTVEHHLSRIYMKLGLRSRAELVRLVTSSIGSLSNA
jgi:hypothetical protein